MIIQMMLVGQITVVLNLLKCNLKSDIQGEIKYFLLQLSLVVTILIATTFGNYK